MDSQLLPISAVTPELLNQMARMIFDEDRAGVLPAWWPALRQAAQDACKQDINEGVVAIG